MHRECFLFRKTHSVHIACFEITAWMNCVLKNSTWTICIFQNAMWTRIMLMHSWCDEFCLYHIPYCRYNLLFTMLVNILVILGNKRMKKKCRCTKTGIFGLIKYVNYCLPVLQITGLSCMYCTMYIRRRHENMNIHLFDTYFAICSLVCGYVI